MEVKIVPAPGEAGPEQVSLSWRPAGGPVCRIARRHTPYGLLVPLAPD